jgi:uncharacterized membrane protein YhaH (DUF805 family)
MKGAELASGEQLLWLFFKLSGRISPAPYVLGGLMLLIVRMFLLYRFALSEMGSEAQSGWALAFWAGAFATAWCNVALTSKRLHDFGKPAIWSLATILFDFLVFFVLPFVRGDPGPNRYGARTNAPA